MLSTKKTRNPHENFSCDLVKIRGFYNPPLTLNYNNYQLKVQ